MRIPRCEAGQKEIERGPRGAEVGAKRKGHEAPRIVCAAPLASLPGCWEPMACDEGFAKIPR
jgi:hypothetical protein